MDDLDAMLSRYRAVGPPPQLRDAVLGAAQARAGRTRRVVARAMLVGSIAAALILMVLADVARRDADRLLDLPSTTPVAVMPISEPQP